MTITPPPARRVPLADRSIVAAKRGVPWWGAVLIAVAMTGLGITIDLTIGDTLTFIFLVFYAVGCLAAGLVVAHRGLFAAIVQPPLILAITVPLVVRALGTSTKGGLKDAVITLALPLVNGFPTMALTTLATVGLGLARIMVQRRAYPPDTPERIEARKEIYRPRISLIPHRPGSTKGHRSTSGQGSTTTGRTNTTGHRTTAGHAVPASTEPTRSRPAQRQPSVAQSVAQRPSPSPRRNS